MSEMPMMASASYASNNMPWEQLVFGGISGVPLGAHPQKHFSFTMKDADDARARHSLREAQFEAATQARSQIATETKPMNTRRLVQVFIADPDENLPIEHCLLYTGEQKLTDLTDQELFFEVDIKSIIDTHNAKRTAIVNKSIKERTENLEPVRIRDLKMTVVTIATF